jgi:uncharacterized protein YaaR (DUF327 family)
MDAGGFAGGYEDSTLKALAAIAKRWGVNHLRVEDNFGGGMFVKLLQPHLRKVGWNPEIEEKRATQQKEARIIDILEPVLNQHRLVVHQDLINAEWETARDPIRSLFYQLTHLTRERGSLTHEDRLDALADAVDSFGDLLVQDTEQAAKEELERLEMEEMEEWMEMSETTFGERHRGRYGDNLIYDRGAPKAWR